MEKKCSSVQMVVSCGSLFYWYAWEREREGGGVSRRVGGWIQGKMTKEKGRIGKKIMSVVVVVCGIWFTFHFFSFFFFFSPNLVVQVQAIRRLIHLFVVIISPLRFANYLLPTTTQSLSLSLYLHRYIYIYIYIYLIMKSKWTGRVKDHG
jgi:hypothetical protein